MENIIFNGELINKQEVRISPSDRGFRYGDGVFDTLWFVGGKIFQLDFHIQRLKNALAAVRIEFDTSSLPSIYYKLLEKNNLVNKETLIRTQITRGESGRGYLPEPLSSPTLIVETMPITEVANKEVDLLVSNYHKIPASALPVRYKLCQGLNSTLARIEAADNNCFDALLLNDDGHVCETSSANIFWLAGNELFTPSLDCGVVEGSIRNAILKNCKYKTNEVAANLSTIEQADAIFLTNIAYKIIPVRSIKPLTKIFNSTTLAEEMRLVLQNQLI